MAIRLKPEEETLVRQLRRLKVADRSTVFGLISPNAPLVRRFATKKERAAGQGFSCPCGRNDLRVEVHPGSFHKRPDGTLHSV